MLRAQARARQSGRDQNDVRPTGLRVRPWPRTCGQAPGPPAAASHLVLVVTLPAIAVVVTLPVAIAAAVAAHLVAGKLAVAIPVEPHDHAIEWLDELLDRDQTVAVVVVLLEPVDHALAHGGHPQRLVLLERELAIAVLIELGKTALARLVDLGLGEAAVLIGVVLLEQEYGAAVTTPAMMAAPAVGTARSGEQEGAERQSPARQQQSPGRGHVRTSRVLFR